MFRIGQKVVCVDAEPHLRYTPYLTTDRNMDGLVAGAIYTVRAVLKQRGVQVIYVHELRRLRRVDEEEQGFALARFRPIVERKTDISIFTEILRRESMPDECAPAAVYGVDWGASA